MRNRLIWLAGLVALLTNSCKREEPAPAITEINATVVNENRMPVNNALITIGASTGSYFGGTRKDTVFALLRTDIDGKVSYQKLIETKWRTYIVAFDPTLNSTGNYLYNNSRYEGTVDGIVNVGVINNITIIMFRR